MWFTVAEVARLLAVSPRTVKRWKRDGLLVLDERGRVLFDHAQVIAEQKKLRGSGAANRSSPLGVS